MSNQDVMSALGRTVIESHPGVTFPKRGTFVDGVIVGAPKVVNLPDFNDQSKTVEKIIFNLNLSQPCWTKDKATKDNPDPDHYEVPAGTMVSLWAQKQMASAIHKAIQKAGAAFIEEGAQLTVRWTESRRIEGRPQPQKIYEAAYVAPVPRMSAASLLGSAEDDDATDG